MKYVDVFIINGWIITFYVRLIKKQKPFSIKPNVNHKQLNFKYVMHKEKCVDQAKKRLILKLSAHIWSWVIECEDFPGPITF